MRHFRNLVLLIVICSAGVIASAQTQNLASAIVPRLVNYSGKIARRQGSATSGRAGVTFAIYNEQAGGAPLWMETQTVALDAKGDYTAQLGATKSAGLPVDLFSTSDARWLGVSVNGGEEQARVLLVSVPYALRAGDAETVGGLPPSAFVLAAPVGHTAALSANSVDGSPVVPPATSNVTTSGGTINALPLWTTATNVQDSAITQTGSGTTAKIGINTAAPTTALDIHGGAAVRGTLVLPASGAATATAGKSSEPINMTVSTFNSGSSTAVGQTFQLRAEPANNNTATPSATFNLLFAHGANPPAETGFSIASNGVVTFAAGQTFPGGSGTITGVNAGTDLTGGGTSGSVTLNVDTTKVPQLNTANTFTGNQTVNGNLSATGLVTGSALNVGGSLFGFGSFQNANAFVGYAGNSTLTGNQNTGSGSEALISETSGISNVANGANALFSDTFGSDNTGLGVNALYYVTSGNLNTAVGYNAGETLNGSETGGAYNLYLGASAGPGVKTNLSEATAIGANAVVNESYAMILGGTGTNAITVGIGTTAPFDDYALDVDATTFSQINSGEVVNAGGGNLYLGMTKGVHKFRVDANGVVYADGGFFSSGADFAESVAVRGSKSGYEPGDVLEIDATADRHLTLAHHRYATLVAGIYSTKPGLLATPHNIDDPSVKASEVPLAVVGIVPCKVTAENGAIARGDLLVTSSRPGYAMKGTDRRRLVGAVVGKALEALPKGSGVIQVLVTLQ